MWSITFIISTLLATAHTSWAQPDRTLSVNPGGPMIPACPTVTTTAQVCSTCIRNHCDVVSTIVNPGFCPRKVPTVTKNYPCSKSTCPGGCKTHYVYPSTLSTATITSEPYPTTTTETTTSESCPTVTAILGRCSTCVMPMCVVLTTIKSICGCPSVVPTVSKRYRCGEPCPGGCAGTIYKSDTATPTCT